MSKDYYIALEPLNHKEKQIVMIDNTSISKTHNLILLAVTLSFCLPAYCDDTESSSADGTKVSSEKIVAPNKEVEQFTLPDQAPKASETEVTREKTISPEKEVKQLALPDKNTKASEPERGLITTKTKKSKRRTASELMSSDDTTKEYVHSIDPDLHYEKARHLTLEKKYNEALKEVNTALTQNPKYYEAKYLGALIYERQGRKQEATLKYKHLLNEKPHYLQAQISYASLLSDLGQNKAAEIEYRKAIDLSFTSSEAHYDLANLLTKESRFKEALQELNICLKLAPDNAAVHNNLGVIYFHQNYKEQSEKEFEQASELDPANTIYMHNLELVRSNDKNTELPSLG